MNDYAKVSFNSTLVRLEAGGIFSVAGHINSFNSTLVRLEVAPIRKTQQHIRSFNSTLVRLEVPSLPGLKSKPFVSIPLWFDWKNPGTSELTPRCSFQFHFGSIGSSIGGGIQFALPCFNSTLVRLEVYRARQSL